MRAVARWTASCGSSQSLAEDRRPDSSRWTIFRRRTFRSGRRSFSRDASTRNSPPRSGAISRSIHARSAAEPDCACRVRARRHVRGDPDRSLPARDRPRASGACGPSRRAGDRTLATKRALVHGDVSPKNILIGPWGPVFLDAECAWFGDPAFDLAFCLNHLLLKGAREGADRARYLAAYAALAHAYLDRRRLGRQAGSEERAASLLPALFLARVDGKSPVEYLTRRERTGRRPPLRRAADRPARRHAWRTSPTHGAARRERPRHPIASGAAASGTRAAVRRSKRRWSLSDGAVGRGIAPAGASRGSREAVERRDGGRRLGGLDVQGALRGIRDGDRARARRAMIHSTSPRIDEKLVALDGTETLSRLGGNALDRGFARRAPCGGGEPQGAAVALSARRRAGARSRCRRSRSSAAARTPDGASTCRTSWSCAEARGASPRRWRRRRRSTMRPDGSWRSAAFCRASPTKAAGGRRFRPTRRRSTR